MEQKQPKDRAIAQPRHPNISKKFEIKLTDVKGGRPLAQARPLHWLKNLKTRKVRHLKQPERQRPRTGIGEGTVILHSSCLAVSTTG
jgi:hypothetical protein